MARRGTEGPFSQCPLSLYFGVGSKGQILSLLAKSNRIKEFCPAPFSLRVVPASHRDGVLQWYGVIRGISSQAYMSGT